MSMRFAYRPCPILTPAWTLQGRADRPRALITLSILGPTHTWVNRCLLDSGADDTVFPDWVAKLIGVDLSSAPTASASGIGLTRSRLQLVEVTLRLTTSGEFHEWKARVGFTSTPLKQPLLGFAGFMQYFTASFFGDLEEVELTTNSKYPGS